MGDVTITDIAKFLDSDLRNNTIIQSAKPIDSAGQGDLGMVRSNLKNTTDILNATKASLIIADNDVVLPSGFLIPVIKTNNARLDFIRILNKFFIHEPTQSIHESVVMGENVTIGEGTVIHPNVTLYDNVTIGKNCVIHSGCVIGSDGFGFEKNDDGDILKFPHIGGVEIHDNVEIQGLTHVARGALGNTIIGKNTKIDGQCHIAHNVKIGQKCLITAGVIFAGSVIVGNNVYIAPASSIINKVNIGDNAFIGMASFVNKDVPEGETVAGCPARIIARQSDK